MTVKKTMTGLGIGMSSMKSGERALLHVDWELAYGEEGSFSFPNVPPMSNVIYEVELIGFDDAREVVYSMLILFMVSNGSLMMTMIIIMKGCFHSLECYY